MADKGLSKGDHAGWDSHGGTAEGHVEEEITEERLTEDTEAARLDATSDASG